MIDLVRLPDDIEQGARGGPGFKTTVVSLPSGVELRNQDWVRARASYNVGYGIRKREHMDELISFFYARRGMGRGFLFKDWLDFTSLLQVTAYIDGEPDTKRLIVKTYPDAINPYYRPITHPVVSSMVVYVGGIATTDYVYEGDGVISFTSDPGPDVHVSCEFNVPARFDSDDLEAILNTYHAGAFPVVPVVEVKVYAPPFSMATTPPLPVDLVATAIINIVASADMDAPPLGPAITAGFYNDGDYDFVGYSDEDCIDGLNPAIGALSEQPDVTYTIRAVFYHGRWGELTLALDGNVLSAVAGYKLVLNGVDYLISAADFSQEVGGFGDSGPLTNFGWVISNPMVDEGVYPVSFEVV